MRSTIRDLISNNKTEKALDFLLNDWEVELDIDVQNSLILLFSEFNRLENEKNLGLCLLDEYNRRINRINLSILKLATSSLKAPAPKKIRNDNLKEIKFSMIGHSGCGKTTYLATLLNEYIKGDYNYILEAGNSDTIKVLFDSISCIEKGMLPDGTAQTKLYEFILSGNNKTSTKEDKLIKMVDYRGGCIEDFYSVERDEVWHNSLLDDTLLFDYFDKSEIIFLGIDLAELYPPTYLLEFRNEGFKHRLSDPIYVINDFISIINSIRTSKMKKQITTNFHLALLFLKSDVLYNENNSEDEVLKRFEPLISYCRKISNKFKVFFPTTYGTNKFEGFGPPKPCLPKNIVESFEWAIKSYEEKEACA